MLLHRHPFENLFHFADASHLSRHRAKTLSGERGSQISIPAVDIHENETEFVILLDVPGLSEDELDIEFADGALTISGERSRASEDSPTRAEIRYGAFQRRFKIPETVDVSTADASLRRGVLRLVLKKNEKELPRKILIQAETSE